MARITFYPLGNADCYRIDLESGKKLLFDYADTRCADDPQDKRSDLPVELRKDLAAAGRTSYDVVAFTHFHDDHVCGAASFFELDHAARYQGDGRIGIDEMWVPAFAITDVKDDLCDDGKILQEEARHRLIRGSGIRVFSRPAKLEAWLKSKGLSLASRQHLITDAGQPVPTWSKEHDGVEFFVHSPFASRQNDGSLIDSNSNSLVFQATFLSGGRATRVLLMADTEYECLSEIVRISRYHGREDKLEWDVVKLPHHSSYASLGPEKGSDKTVPVPNVAWLYEEQGQIASRTISTSDRIPSSGEAPQPPHRQAANYYRTMVRDHSGEYLVTMEHPTSAKPEPLVVNIDGFGASVTKASLPIGGAAIGTSAPRAGHH